jgi:hypothetical protein
VVYFLLQIVFSLESSFRCTSPILGEIGGNLTDKESKSDKLASISEFRGVWRLRLQNHNLELQE